MVTNERVIGHKLHGNWQHNMQYCTILVQYCMLYGIAQIPNPYCVRYDWYFQVSHKRTTKTEVISFAITW